MSNGMEVAIQVNNYGGNRPGMAKINAKAEAWPKAASTIIKLCVLLHTLFDLNTKSTRSAQVGTGVSQIQCTLSPLN